MANVGPTRDNTSKKQYKISGLFLDGEVFQKIKRAAKDSLDSHRTVSPFAALLTFMNDLVEKPS